VAREAAARVAEGEPLREALVAELARAAGADDEPLVYAPVAPEALQRLPPGRGLEMAPYALRCRRQDPSLAFGDLLSAAAFYYPLRARLELLERARSQIAQGAARQRRRLERAVRRLDQEPADGQDPGRLQQLGDLLLANPDATAVDERVRVDDLYAGGEPVEIPVDSQRDLRANAERYYRRAQRLRRKIDQDARRLEQVQSELERLACLERRAAEMADIDQLNDAIDGARELDLPLKAHQLREPEAEGAPTLDEIAW
jgi:predicted ribosome quality control (RQC) complex YloA/Tae2 family protein